MIPVFLAGSASGPTRLVLYDEPARLAAEGGLAQNRRAIRAHTLAAFAVSIPLAVAGWFALWRLLLMYSLARRDALEASP